MTKYYALRDGEYVPVTKTECFAKEDGGNPEYRQRWYMEDGIVVRLPRTKEGEELFLFHIRDKQNEAKYQERKYACVYYKTKKCSGWKKAADGTRKCDTCQCRHTSRTVDLDKDFNRNDDEESTAHFEPAADCDVSEMVEEAALLKTLMAALSSLDEADRTLIEDIFWHRKTERQLAPMLGLKEPKSVNKRKQRVLEILRQNPALKKFFE